jgi:pimeloyl-ACP methyl ester carboxylesterase
VTLIAVAVVAVLLGVAAAAERILEQRDARRFPRPGQLVEVGGGRLLHLLCAGEIGPAIVIEQGAGEPAILWRSLQQQAASFARVCLYDRAGYGWSPPAPAPQGVEERAADLRRLLDAGGVAGPYILVAHSYGGLVVQSFARQFPELVAGMVMVDAIDARMAAHPDYLALIGKGRVFLPVMRAAASVGLMRLAGLMGGDDEAPVDAEAQAMAGAQAARPSFFRAIAGDLASIREAARDSDAATQSLGDLPLTVITHGKPFPGPFAGIEALWRPGQEAIAALSSRGRLVVAANSNHMVHMDEPELVLAALREMAAVAVSRSAHPVSRAPARA